MKARERVDGLTGVAFHVARGFVPDAGSDLLMRDDVLAIADAIDAEMDKAAPFLRALLLLDSQRGGAGGQALTTYRCRACGKEEVAGSTSSVGLLCRACGETLRGLVREKLR